MTVPLPDLARELLDRHAFVVLATVNPDGTPQSSVIWAKYDGGDLVFSTVLGRRKTTNMQRERHVSLCAYDPENPYRYFEVRGEVSLTEEGGDALINELSLAYTGKPYVEQVAGVTRVVCRVRPTKVVGR